jgi:hypothetical protein
MGRWSGDGNRLVSQVTHRLRHLSEMVEATNRLSTAIAAIRMEKAKGGSAEDAINYAREIVDITHGDYSGFNTPRFMRTPMGRLATQFRKFQIIQGATFIRAAATAFKGASKDERALGRRWLTYAVGHMAILGGVTGMPLYGLASFIASALHQALGNDDPWDTEQKLLDVVGDGTWGKLLTHGVPYLMGLDLSRRVGAGETYNLLPNADIEFSRKGAQALLASAAGPFLGGMLPNMFDGVGKITQGQYWKGLEELLPRGLKDISKAVRGYNQGVTDNKGNLLVGPGDVGKIASAMQALGLPTTSITERSRASNLVYQAEQHYKDRAGEITREFVAARHDNDTDAMAKARADWMKLQDSRTANGFKRQPLSTLFQAAHQQKTIAQTAINGVRYGRDNKAFVQHLVGDPEPETAGAE